MAVDMFLKLSNIKGESTDDFHKGEIEILSFSWGATQTGSFAHGSGGGSGKVSMNDFHFVHKFDKASPLLMQAACKGTHFPEATLSVRKAGGKQQDYLIYKMTDLLVSGYQTGGSSSELPMEQISLNFSKVEIRYQDDTGRAHEASCGGGKTTIPTETKTTRKG